MKRIHYAVGIIAVGFVLMATSIGHNPALKDWVLSISQSEQANYTVGYAMGEFELGTITANGEDAYRFADVGGPAIMPTPPAGGLTMVIKSSSANDAAAGTGARTMKVHYLDASGYAQEQTVTLNGTTPVTLSGSIMYINDLYSLTVGSNGVAVGDVTIYESGGSIANDLYGLVVAGGNKSLVPHRRVPVDETWYLKQWTCTESAGKRAAFKIRSTDMNGVLIDGVFCFKDAAYIRNDQVTRPMPAVPIPPLSVIKVSHWDDANGAEGSGSYWWYAYKN